MGSFYCIHLAVLTSISASLVLHVRSDSCPPPKHIKQEGDCSVRLDMGNGDFKTINLADSHINTVQKTSCEKFEFEWKPCGYFNYQPSFIKNPTEYCNNTRAVVGHKYTKTCRTHASASDRGQFQLIGDTLSINYTLHGTTTTTAKVDLICDCTHKEEGRLEYDGGKCANEPGTHLKLKFISLHVCPKLLRRDDVERLSTGSTILIIAACVMSTYCILGSIRGACKGQKGLNKMPHSDFWLELPKLCKDGVRFTFGGCYGLHRIRYSRVVEDRHIPIVDV